MFKNDELKNHLQTSSVVKTQSAVIAEWNMNMPDNIFKIGNYRYRPTTSGSNYQTITNTFDPNDQGNYYTNATDADVVIDGGIDDSNVPFTLTATKDKIKMLYSLEDCFKPFRPRSGINKARYFSNSYLHHSNVNMAKRPRYYMADKNDQFKYWSSYRTEGGVEYGIANKLINGQYNIEDSAPFVVYENKIPTNKIIVKMQTNVGSLDLGTFSNSSSTFSDPFYGNANKTTPVRWKVQSLKSNNWVDVLSFNQSSTSRYKKPYLLKYYQQ